MRLGRPLATASAVAAMTGASLVASPALAHDSNSSTSTSSSSSSTSTSSSSSSSSFRFSESQTTVSASTNTAFTVSGSGCTGQQATVGIALYAPDGSVSDVVKTEAASDGSWSTDVDLAALIKSIGASAETSTDGWSLGAGCMNYNGKTETNQQTNQQQTRIVFDDTRITGSYEISTRSEGQSQTFTFNARGFVASEKVTVVLRGKSDSSLCYTLGELTADSSGNVQGDLPAPAEVTDGDYLLVLTGSHHSETATSQTVTTVSNHTFTKSDHEADNADSSGDNSGGSGDSDTSQDAQRGGGDSTSSSSASGDSDNSASGDSDSSTSDSDSEDRNSDNGDTERSSSASGDSDRNTQRDSTSSSSTSGDSDSSASGDSDNGGDHNANGNANTSQGNTTGQEADNRVDRGKEKNSSANESSSTSKAAGDTRTSNNDKSLAHTGSNGLLFGGIAAALVAIGGGALFLRRRNKA